VSDTRRILDLPREDHQGEPGELNDELRLPDGTWTLRPIQETALRAIRACQGAFLPIGVGHGKSLIAILAATVLDRQLAIILAPASTVRQLRETYEELSAHFRVRPAHILSYSVLSRPEGTALLEDLITGHADTDVVLVCDEAHKIRRRESARTKRVIRFMRAHQGVAFIALSGTMTSKGIEDMSHLAELALRDGSPLPTSPTVLEIWCRCLDVGLWEGHATRRDWKWLHPVGLWNGADISTMRGRERVETARAAVRARLRSAPGVIASQEGSVECSLYLRRDTDIEIPERIQTLLDQAADGVDPEGEPILDDLTSWRIQRHITAGFYYRWLWPDGRPDETWLEARREWTRRVRAELERNAREGYDSPKLVGNQIEAEYMQGARLAMHRAWYAWERERHKPPPPVEAVWVDSYLIDHAEKWLDRELLWREKSTRYLHRPGIIWYSSSAVGEQLAARGIPTFGAGEDPMADPYVREGLECAMSIRAHGTGKNLQEWSWAYVLEPPSGGAAWEQLLGRLHRQGQTADDVTFAVAQHAPSFVGALRSARADAQYIESVSGNRQKLCYLHEID
jgi:hypothetical protein